MALLPDLRKRLAGCKGCRRRRAALGAALDAARRRFGFRKAAPGGIPEAVPDGAPDGIPDGGRAAPDFSRWFLVVEHIDAGSGTATFRLNGREDEGYRLGLPIPLDWDGRPAGPGLLIEAMAAEALPTVRRELAGAGPPDFSRLKPLEGRKIGIARHIERHYRCEDCRYG